MRALVFALCLFFSPAGLLAQDTVPRAPVLTIESDRVYAGSQFGRKMAEQFARQRAALAAENRGILAELTAEEIALTNQRELLSAQDFLVLTDAFDEKVTRLRREQDAKQRALEQRSDSAREQFFLAVRPVLEQIMRDRGAAVMIERRNVVLDISGINITEIAIARIDTTLLDEEP
jgi:Skp family chaperone for outer membrane proteins